LLLSPSFLPPPINSSSLHPPSSFSYLGSVEVAKALLKAGAHHNVEDHHHFQPLHVAAADGCVGVTKVGE